MRRLLRDAELLEAKLDNIDGAERFSVHIVNVVKAKRISHRPKAARNVPSGESMSA